MSVFEKTEALIRYAETLVLLGRSVAERITPNASRSKAGFPRWVDDFYRRFLCPPLSLVVGFLPVIRGYFVWTVCFAGLYLLTSLLLPVAFDLPWSEIARSDLFNWGLPLSTLAFFLFPLPSVHSNSGVSAADVKTMSGTISKLGIDEAAQLEGVRANIEIRELRMDERFKALRWGSTALWAFLIFFVQRFLEACSKLLQ